MFACVPASFGPVYMVFYGILPLLVADVKTYDAFQLSESFLRLEHIKPSLPGAGFEHQGVGEHLFNPGVN